MGKNKTLKQKKKRGGEMPNYLNNDDNSATYSEAELRRRAAELQRQNEVLRLFKEDVRGILHMINNIENDENFNMYTKNIETYVPQFNANPKFGDNFQEMEAECSYNYCEDLEKEFNPYFSNCIRNPNRIDEFIIIFNSFFFNNPNDPEDGLLDYYCNQYFLETESEFIGEIYIQLKIITTHYLFFIILKNCVQKYFEELLDIPYNEYIRFFNEIDQLNNLFKDFFDISYNKLKSDSQKLDTIYRNSENKKLFYAADRK